MWLQKKLQTKETMGDNRKEHDDVNFEYHHPMKN